MKKLINLGLKLFQKYKNFILYSIIGVSGATLDFVIFLVLFNYFHLDKNIATLLSTSAGIINNFSWNVIFNFKVRDNLVKRFVSFYAVGGFGILLTFAIFFLFVDLLKMPTNIVKLGSIIVVVIVQYFLNKNISFKKEKVKA